MPLYNFMIEDLLGALKAVALLPVFLLVPGYVAAWLLNVFGFRRRMIAFWIAFANPAFVHSISTSRVSPENPFVQPGHPVPLRYQYFWLMMRSLANQVGGSAISPRQAMVGGTFWAGVGLMSLLATYLVQGPSWQALPPPRLHRHSAEPPRAWIWSPASSFSFSTRAGWLASSCPVWSGGTSMSIGLSTPPCWLRTCWP